MPELTRFLGLTETINGEGRTVFIIGRVESHKPQQFFFHTGYGPLFDRFGMNPQQRRRSFVRGAKAGEKFTERLLVVGSVRDRDFSLHKSH